ncbi:hypothetical protein [Cellulomonas sp. P22]|uniref:hypothetical protein n=1 Tax=Cellulomonas sp. P22 TaxID=3373189 RepID=UPI0037BFFB83
MVHAHVGALLIADAHWDASLLAMPTLEPDSPFVIALHGPLDVAHGEGVAVTGVWTGRGIDVRTAARRNVAPPPPQPLRGGLRPRPPGIPGPPTEIEVRLLADGTMTDRLPYGDGTLHVVADDVDTVADALTPVYGDRLRVHRAMFSQQQRRVATAALHVADALEVACAVGTTPLDDARPAEMVNTLEVGWVPDVLAEALVAVPDGLVEVTAHVRVMQPR